MADKKISELTNITGSTIADTDEFVVVDASASETKAITAAELRTAIGNGDFTVTGNLTVQGTTITVDSASAQNIVLGDNDKMTFGDAVGGDLQIYHNGFNSYIKDVGTGNFELSSNGDGFYFRDGSSNYLLTLSNGGAAQLWHNGSAKLATTATGVDVTGTLTSDGLTVARAGGAAGSGNVAYIDVTSSYGGLSINSSVGNNAFIEFLENGVKTAGFNSDATANVTSLQSANGHALAFNTNGTTERMRIDSSGNVGIGTDSPEGQLHLYSSSVGAPSSDADDFVIEKTGDTGLSILSTTTGRIYFGDAASNDQGSIRYVHTDNSMRFETDSTEAMRIDSSGNVGIGTSSPSYALDVDGEIRIKTNTNGLIMQTSTSSDVNVLRITGGNSVVLRDSTNSDALTIDSSGNVGIGGAAATASGYSKYLHVQATSTGSSLHLTDGTSGHGASDGFELLSYNGTAYVIQRENNPLLLYTNDTERLRIDSSGKLSLTASDQGIQIGPDIAAYTIKRDSNGLLNFRATQQNFNGYIFDTVDGERVRIDSSGNFLVGTTSTTLTGLAGFTYQGGITTTSNNGSLSAIMNRNTNDGDIVQFRKDNATVGSIGVAGSDLIISGRASSAKSGIRFDNNTITPALNGADVDASVDLGYSSRRFRNLYLSGGIEIENGTGNVGVGKQALNSNTASNNTAVGYQAGYSNTTGTRNTFLGYQSGYSFNDTVSGNNYNTFLGYQSGYYITTGTKNVILGSYNGNQSGLDIRTSSNNIVLSDGDGNPRGYYWSDSGETAWHLVSPKSNQLAMKVINSASSLPYGLAVQYTGSAPNNTSSTVYYFSDTVGNKFSVYSNGNVVNQNNSYGAISDEKLKENIIDASSQWDDIKALTVRKYSMKSDNLDAPNRLGVIAQEVEAAGMGGLVFESPDLDPQTNEDLGTVTKQINYSILYMKAVKALQEAMDRIETLEAKVTALENA